MNLQQLTSGTPAAKKWLDIVAYDIKCNSIIPIVPIAPGTSNRIISADFSSSITCDDLGAMTSVGDLDMSGGRLRHVAEIDTPAATLNITTPTTRIEQGGSDFRVSVDSDYRLIVNPSTTRLLCGPVGPTLIMNDNNTFQLASYFAGNGSIECITDQISVIGPQAKSHLVMGLAQISQSLFNGISSIPRVVINNFHTFYDDTGAEKLRISNAGVRISNAFILPPNAGAAGNVLTSSGTGVSSWAPPVALNPFNQSLNTSDNVVFNSILSNSVDNLTRLNLGTGVAPLIGIGNAACLTNILGTLQINSAYTLPGVAGTIGQVLTVAAGGPTWVSPSPGLFSGSGPPITVQNTLAATSIIPTGVGSLTFPANYFVQGTSILIKAGGSFRNNANNTQFTFRLLTNGLTSILSSGLLTLSNIPSVIAWNLEIQLTQGIGTLAPVNFCFKYSTGQDLFGFMVPLTSSSLNPAISNTLDVQLTWATANVNNLLQCSYFTITKLY